MIGLPESWANVHTCAKRGLASVGKTSARDQILAAVRQDAPSTIVSVDYELVIDVDESDQRLERLCHVVGGLTVCG